MATFNDIEKANSTIRTTNIKGKDYAEVNQRIKAFRMLYPDGYINTKIVELDMTNGIVVMSAEVGYTDEAGQNHLLGSGTSYEWKNDPKSMVNKTSFIENCETSAVGRALGMLGLGVDVAIASAEEVKYAVQHQEEMKKAPTSAPKNYICKVCGNPVTDYGKMKAGGIAKKSYDEYGKVMCYNCAHEEKVRRERAQEVDVIAEAEAAAAALELPFPIDE